MRIKVKYSVSEGPHQVDITSDDIKAMRESGLLSIEQSTLKGKKTITIEGAPEELQQMGQLLIRFAKNHNE
jgi:hypothetical protein